MTSKSDNPGPAIVQLNGTQIRALKNNPLEHGQKAVMRRGVLRAEHPVGLVHLEGSL